MVQAVLTENRVNRATGSDAKHPSLLVGLAFDENGERLTPSHAVKKGTRYRDYVSISSPGRPKTDQRDGGSQRQPSFPIKEQSSMPSAMNMLMGLHRAG